MGPSSGVVQHEQRLTKPHESSSSTRTGLGPSGVRDEIPTFLE